ncbi:hypothetical protein BX667DRAFT_506210 [Coemansia mojavensis]|nr:hypothetical protein BX667DRAFT_506210 [Coemansia mojavensis]
MAEQRATSTADIYSSSSDSCRSLQLSKNDKEASSSTTEATSKSCTLANTTSQALKDDLPSSIAIASRIAPSNGIPANIGKNSVCLSPADLANNAVNLSRQQLSCILPQIAIFAKDITRLILTENKLVQLPDELGYLRQLQFIDISLNQLRAIPATAGYWQNLRVLIASGNRIADIPTSIRHIPQLSIVDLSNNRLQAVPVALWKMQSLEQINLAHNLIRAIPAPILAPDGALAQNRTKQTSFMLYGCPIGRGIADHIDLPFTVLSMRFIHGVVKHDEVKLQASRQPVPSLTDIIICRMANNNDRLSEDLPEHIRARFNDLLECDYCSKLYPADAGIKRWRLVYRKKLIWPVEYNFCSAHWNTEKQRIAALFAPPISCI